ncbi:MAG TPA: proton-conducting transporter membrane subunit [Candidatus Angelobacter sp.]|nr:proton-conducting transporter membrane subunit [Candidatus Angelobacter sp.]
MLLASILLIPLLASVLVLFFASRRAATLLALAAGILEIIALALTAWRVAKDGSLHLGRYLRADALTTFFLLNAGLVFFLVLLYSTSYIRHIPLGRFSSPRWFYSFLFLFLFSIVAVYLANNLGFLWIMMEATTLASALLVGFYNTEGAVEAGWKYLIVCTVGLAFALFGTIVIYVAAVHAGLKPEEALQWPVLAQAGALLAGGSHTLLKLGFIFLVVGYGTKIGLVPMHSWLPDAHAEAPSPVSAMLSAALLNCAVYALVRYDAIIVHAIGPVFSHRILIFFGLASVLVAGLLMIVQQDMKRLLAYSSVEHMGIIATGLGIGGFFGLYGALLHTFTHSMAKSLLFFSAGRVRETVGTSRMVTIKGLARRLPWTSAALVTGLVAIVGLPPFGLFVSEFSILRETFGQMHWFTGIVLLVMLVVVFAAMVFHALRVLPGTPEQLVTEAGRKDGRGPEFLAMGICAVVLLAFGVTVPLAFSLWLKAAMAVLQ